MIPVWHFIFLFHPTKKDVAFGLKVSSFALEAGWGRKVRWEFNVLPVRPAPLWLWERNELTDTMNKYNVRSSNIMNL